ncbi:MAG: hypothetical protein ACLGIM_23025 [Alphaproteobacteria bacterium]
MFSFRNRKKYNGTVDAKLNEAYGIATRDNPKFPGVLAYLKMIDEAWDSKFTEEEAAMFIATLYYSGLKREGHHVEARVLAPCLASTGQADFGAGKIAMQRLAVFMAAIEKANTQA